jgi:hypothetical protein
VQVFRGYWMVNWFKEQFGHHEQLRALAEDVAPEQLFDRWPAAVPPGSMGLMLQPYWTPGIRVPGREAKGAIIGFGDVHTRAHVYRAILEGLAYALREGKERIERRSGVAITELRVSGGGSQSDCAMQLTADIFGLPTARPHVYETSGWARRSMRRWGWAAPGFRCGGGGDDAGGEGVRAGAENQRMYDRLYRQVYRKMYKQLQPLYRDIAEITGYPRRSAVSPAKAGPNFRAVDATWVPVAGPRRMYAASAARGIKRAPSPSEPPPTPPPSTAVSTRLRPAFLGRIHGPVGAHEQLLDLVELGRHDGRHADRDREPGRGRRARVRQLQRFDGGADRFGQARRGGAAGSRRTAARIPRRRSAPPGRWAQRVRCSAWATFCRQASPAAWPRVSLYSLKWSTSSTTSDSGWALRIARCHSFSRKASKWRRLAILVSGSSMAARCSASSDCLWWVMSCSRATNRPSAACIGVIVRSIARRPPSRWRISTSRVPWPIASIAAQPSGYSCASCASRSASERPASSSGA